MKAKRERLRREQEQQKQQKKENSFLTLQQRLKKHQQGTTSSASSNQEFIRTLGSNDEADMTFAFEGYNPCAKPEKAAAPQQHAVIMDATKAQLREQRERHEEIERDLLRQLALERQAREEAEAKLQEFVQNLKAEQQKQSKEQEIKEGRLVVQTTTDSSRASLKQVQQDAEESKQQALAQQQEQEQDDNVAAELHQQIVLLEKKVQELKKTNQQWQTEQQKEESKAWKQREQELVAGHEQELQQEFQLRTAATKEFKQQCQTDIETLRNGLEQRMEALQTQFEDKLANRIKDHDKQVQRLESSTRRIRKGMAQRIQLQQALEEELKLRQRRLRKQDRIETQLRGKVLSLQDENAKLNARLWLQGGDMSDHESVAAMQTSSKQSYASSVRKRSAPTSRDRQSPRKRKVSDSLAAENDLVSTESSSSLFSNQEKRPRRSPPNKQTADKKDGDNSSERTKREKPFKMPSYLGVTLRFFQGGFNRADDDHSPNSLSQQVDDV